MHYKILLTCIALLQLMHVYAHNDWVNHAQEYYTFPIHEEGVYRLTYQNLVDAGISTGSFDPRNLQIFKNGKEIPLYVHTETDGIFHSTDYIEFFARGNDGSADTELYRTSKDQVNPYYSLYNDTARYFLTWNQALSNLRYKTLDVPVSDNKLTYCIDEFHIDYKKRFNYAYAGPDYGPGEGWVSNSFAKGGEFSQTFTLDGYYNPENINTRCDYSISSVTGFRHILDIDFAGSHKDTSYANYFSYKGFIEGNDIQNGEATFVASAPDSNYASVDVQTLSFLHFTYPRSLQAETDSLFKCIFPEVGTDQYKSATITGLRSGTAIFYDNTNNTRTTSSVTEGEATVTVHNVKNNEMIISINGSHNSVAQIEKCKSKNSGSKSFLDFSKKSNQGNYIIITHPKFWDKALEYANYRLLTGYTPIVVDINELYTQFGYGIIKHPLGMRHFAQYALEHWEIKPEYVFIIGKGLHVVSYRNNSGRYENCLIPAAGSPSSDMMTFVGISGETNSVSLATGRLAAQSTADIDIYLDKVKDHENQENGLWMKNILHFGGGGNTNEQAYFKSYLQQFESIIEGENFGATVHTTLKNSGDPLEITKSDIIRNKIEEGVTLMTFFGHASSGSFDQSLDEPIHFNNKGKHPFILANSCYSGDIFNDGATSVSERWMLIKDKGAIGFLASVGTGMPYPLYQYSLELYKQFGIKHYNESIGKCIVNTTNQLVEDDVIYTTILASQDFNLHGDPAIHLHSATHPDVIADESSIFFKDEVTADVDSFAVYVVPVNSGKTFADSLSIFLERNLPDGSKQTAEKHIVGLQYRDTVEFKFLTNASVGAGYNTFSLTFDKENRITELSELNNSTTIEFFVKNRLLVPIYPYEFAIVPSTNVTLSASTIDASTVGGECYFEIDTEYDFTGVTKQTTTLAYDNTLVQWSPVGLQDGKTYYWRVGLKKDGSEAIDWNESSFTIENGKTGWSQTGYGQSRTSDFSLLAYNNLESLEFSTTRQMLTCGNVGSASNDLEYNLVQYSIDGVKMGSSGCGPNPYITVAVIDSISLKPWAPDRMNYGHTNYPDCGGYKHNYFDFNAKSVDSREALATFLRDSVPAGNYILCYTFISGKFKSWNDNVYTAFEELGAKSVRTIEDNYPYIFFVQKGKPQTAQERVGNSPNDELDLNIRLESNAPYGTIRSKPIGPASDWSSSMWRFSSEETDTIRMKLIGTNSKGEETVLADKIDTDEFDLSTIPDDIVYLNLEALLIDTILKTPSMFDTWKVYYKPLPETAISIADQFFFHADTIQEGDSIEFSIATKNVSPYDMDSLLIEYTIKDENNKIVTVTKDRLETHSSASITTAKVAFPTVGMDGSYSLKADFNPENETGQFDQMEKFHFNNVYERPFVVQTDKRNPLVSVRFDGMRILNGEMVSAKPTIEIEMIDENEYFFIDDTSLVAVYIKNNAKSDSRLKFNTDEYKPIYHIDSLGRQQLEFSPASKANPKALLVYRPEFTVDGTYTLKVEYEDKNGNTAGNGYYEVAFTIVTESSITNIVNYPNPFSTSTRFVFTLTGSELPEDFRIQIMTISGKLVREIGLDDLGLLRIGNNITSYAWDGTDIYGDQLANGVYYYRVFTKINGESVKHRSNSTDNLFKNGYGKMVLMR